MFEISPEVEQITITKFFKGLILAIIKMLNNNVFSKKKATWIMFLHLPRDNEDDFFSIEAKGHTIQSTIYCSQYLEKIFVKA